MTSLHHDPGVSSGRVISGLVPDDLSTVPLVDPKGSKGLNKSLLRDSLERRIGQLMEAGGAWHDAKRPSSQVLAAIARTMNAWIDERGIHWLTESKIVALTGLKQSAVRMALQIIAGDARRPGALYARRFMRPGERYVRDGQAHATDGYLYVAHRLGLAVSNAAPRSTNLPSPRRSKRMGEPDVPRVRNCRHQPVCIDPNTCSQRTLDEYRRPTTAHSGVA
jgi:hypothetical protein